MRSIRFKLVANVAPLLLFVTVTMAHAQGYTLTKIAGNNGATINSGAAIAYQGQLYYFERIGVGAGNIYRDNGFSAELVRSVNYTSSVALGPIIDGQLYYSKDNRQILVEDPLQLPIDATSPSVDLTSTSYITTFNGRQLFSGTSLEGIRLYRREPEGLVLVDDSSDVKVCPSRQCYAEFNNELIMRAQGALGVELYRTDGYSTSLVADIQSGTGNSDPGAYGSSGFRQVGQNLYFSAIGPDGRELYVYDGATVSQVADIRPGILYSDPNYLTSHNGVLVFSASGPFGREPYVVDSNGLRLLADLQTGTNNSSLPSYFTEYNGLLYFEATPNNSAERLFRTNGNWVENTGITGPDLFDFYRDPAERPIYHGRFYFPVAGGISSTDGSTFVSVPGATGTARELQPFAGDLFVSFDKGLGTELYRWDGTVFSLVADIATGCGFDGGVCYPNSSYPSDFMEASGALYFFAVNNGTVGLYRLTADVSSADFNVDGTINASDYVAWRKLFGTFTAANDYYLWRSHFGRPASGHTADGSVPESQYSLYAAILVIISRFYRIRSGPR